MRRFERLFSSRFRSSRHRRVVSRPLPRRRLDLRPAARISRAPRPSFRTRRIRRSFSGENRSAPRRRSPVRDRDFALRPIGSVQDILRVTPGLVMVQHSGGGKANQYFLRGFDADHGTDLALSIDGVPINMVSHAHGQGFADTNFIIPEVVERVEITKGPYFANQGDFATAGAVNLVSRDGFEHSSLGVRLGRLARTRNAGVPRRSHREPQVGTRPRRRSPPRSGGRTAPSTTRKAGTGTSSSTSSPFR